MSLFKLYVLIATQKTATYVSLTLPCACIICWW